MTAFSAKYSGRSIGIEGVLGMIRLIDPASPKKRTAPSRETQIAPLSSPRMTLRTVIAAVVGLFLSCSLQAVVVNVDFSRDITGANPGGNPAPVLYAGTGPAADAGTIWNDLRVPLAASGDSGANTIIHPVQFTNLSASDGSPTSIGVRLTSGFNAAVNGAAAASSSVVSLQNDRVYSSTGNAANLTIRGLNPARQYRLIFIGAAAFSTAFTVNSVSKVASGNTYDGTWTEGGEYVSFGAVTPTAAGEILVGIQDGTAPIDSFGVIAGLQIIEGLPVHFFYASGAATTGGQFNASYPPTNLMNSGFTSPTNTINTTVDYLAPNNNYATISGTTTSFNLTFEFAAPSEIDGMHFWNYIFRNGATSGSTSGTFGVNSYTLTFYNGPGATGATIGSVFSGSLAPALFNALNVAQSVSFPASYQGVRSVVMRVLSNHGGATFTGMNEVAFNGPGASTAITSFTSSVPFVQRPATAVLSWQVIGTVTSLEILPGIGNVLPLTSGGTGSVAVSPIGEQTYTLVLNGNIQQSLSLVGLPTREKLHLYLLIGQSNMQGVGSLYDAVLDAPVPRVVKFGSRNGMESIWVKGGHPLTGLASTGGDIGMGIEFGKAMLAAQSDPEVVIGLINHAMGASAIQWWMPGVIDNDQINPATGLNYYLYDEAVVRVNAASSYGVLKGVLWHQGEYNSVTNTTPDSDPDGYAARLQTLVSNLRGTFANPALPFVCGKLVPTSWVNESGVTINYTGLPFRAAVEAALADLPNQRTNTFCVDNAGLRGREDQMIHFDAYSQRLLGQRYAAAMNTLYANPMALYFGGFYTPAEMAQPQMLAPLGDNDRDGLVNFLEYAFRTDPTRPQAVPVSTSAIVTVPGSGEFPAVTFRERMETTAPLYAVEVAIDLSGPWKSNIAGQPAVTLPVGAPVDNGDGTWSITARDVTPITPSTPKRFFRIRVTAP